METTASVTAHALFAHALGRGMQQGGWSEPLPRNLHAQVGSTICQISASDKAPRFIIPHTIPGTCWIIERCKLCILPKKHAANTWYMPARPHAIQTMCKRKLAKYSQCWCASTWSWRSRKNVSGLLEMKWNEATRPKTILSKLALHLASPAHLLSSGLTSFTEPHWGTATKFLPQPCKWIWGFPLWQTFFLHAM